MFAMNLQEIFRYIDSNHQNFIKELVSLVKQPSVSAKNEGIQECAKKTESIMTEIGFSTKILQEKGNPVVYGELSSSKAQKTLLFTTIMMCNLRNLLKNGYVVLLVAKLKQAESMEEEFPIIRET